MSQPSTPPTEAAPNRKPFYLRWWFIVIVAVLVIGLIGSLKPPAEDPDTSAPPTDTGGAPTSTVTATSPTSTPTGVEVVQYIAAQLERPTLLDACTTDGVGWACNVTKVEPLNDAEMRVTVTQLTANVQGVAVALAFKNFASTAPDAPMPNLVRVVVVSTSGEELGRVDN